MPTRIDLPRKLLVALTFAIAVVSTPAESAGKSFLWKATRGSSSLYLVGSVHLLTKDYYPLSAALETAFKESNLLVEEIDLGEMMTTENQMQTLMSGMLPTGQTLDKVVSAATMAAVEKRLESIGMPVEPLKRFKPWLLSITLLGMEWQKAGFEAELGLDKHFYDRARAEKRRVQGLETVAFQISRFDDLTMEDQDRLLAQALNELDTQKAAVTRLADAWKAGDAGTVEAIVLQDLKSDPRLYQRMLVERNRDWLPKLEAIATRNVKAFVVVGAAHLIGPDGLLSMLKAKGYTIEQL